LKGSLAFALSPILTRRITSTPSSPLNTLAEAPAAKSRQGI
jgi:hypothetical protein